MRNSFDFYNPVSLHVGKGKIAKVASLIPPFSKVLLTYGGGSIKRNGIYDQVKTALKDFEVIEFGGIESNPDYHTLLKAVTICKTEKIDFILAVGGGSIIDGSKFIAAAAKFDKDPWTIIIKGLPIKEALPLGAIMTMPATSSEMNNGGVISRRDRKEKFPFFSLVLFPQFAILDPTVVYSIPKKQIGNGIVDCFVHVVEQYITSTDNYKITDRFAEGELKNLIDLAPALMGKDIPDYEVCADYILTATLGLNGWIGMGAVQDWAAHKIGHELTALEGLDHAETLAIIYPGVMHVMKEEKQEKLLQYAENVWHITKGTDEEKIEKGIHLTEQFFIQVGKKVHLSDYNLGQTVIDIIVNRFEARGSVLGENGIVTPKHVRKILENRL